MKKFLLFILVFTFAGYTMAQNQLEQTKNKLRVLEGPEVLTPQNHPAPVLNQNKTTNEDVNRIPIGMAANQRTIRREETHVVSYNIELDVISVTFVLDPATYDEVNNIGDLGIVYSEDHGQTWSDPVLLLDNADDGHLNEYPSGIIYNPDGNTEIENAFGVSQNTTKYNDDYFYRVYGTRQLNGGNHNIDIFEDPNHEPYNGYWNMFGLNQYDDKIYCMNMSPIGDWNMFETAELEPIVGEFNGTTFDWEILATVDAELAQAEADDRIVWTGQWQGMDSGTEIVWSSDGQIGYMWMVGVWADEATGYQPIIFRTSDAGESWDMVELDFLNDEMQAFLDPYIIESSSGQMIPHIYETAGAVDYNGDLQLFVVMGSTSADVINHPDSIGYHWVYPGDIFYFPIDEDGIKEVDMLWIDSLNTSNVLQDTEGNYATDGGWQHRLSVAKNEWDEQMFLTWIDTRDAVNNELNMDPDIFGWSICTWSGLTSEEVICFTEGTLYETFYFFTYGADMALESMDNGNYVIPYITGVSPGEYSSNTSTRTDPVTISYVTGIEFVPLCWGAVDEVNESNRFTVTQNNPNPFSGNTTIEVTTRTSLPVMVEVSNIMGQTIYNSNEGNVNGSKEITLNSQNMEAGVYFYTVTVGNERITKKMVVK